MKFNSNSGKLAGKKSSRKGIPNKSSKELKTALKSLLEQNIDNLQSDIDKLEPKERLDVLLKLANFVLPRMKAVEFTSEDKSSIFKPVIINLGDEQHTDKHN